MSRSDIARETWKDPKKRERRIAGLHKEEAKRKMSERAKAAWKDPKKRANKIAGLKKAWKDPQKAERMFSGLRDMQRNHASGDDAVLELRKIGIIVG